MLQELIAETPMPSARPPRLVHALRAVGMIGVAAMVAGTLSGDPAPSTHGRGLVALLGLAALVAGILASCRRGRLPTGQRFAGMLLVSAGGIALAVAQPGGAAIGAAYYVIAVASIRMTPLAGQVLTAIAVGGQAIAVALTDDKPFGPILGLVFATVPWYLVIRLLRQLREGRDRAEHLVEELRESRAAQAAAAALNERARLARDMHDVLAHSLSGLALQLEAARLLARDRDADPDVVEAIERAHRLAGGGLDEARRAIAALRGDELPGPERLQALADAFAEHSEATCTVSVEGAPRALDSEARMAVYRTAQEALTNVRRHSAADRVDVRLAYGDDGVTLCVADHGPGAPVAVGGDGGGYGLTGMRERAELLGGRLCAEPAADGFRVELWLPA